MHSPLADLKDTDIRLDGQIRASAPVPEHPGVILAFDARKLMDNFAGSKGGLSFVQDHYDNLRSIALTLEALRTVDRYGGTEHGEQYQGFRTLPSAPVPSPTNPRYVAAKRLHFIYRLFTK